jgi:hypothetical protein
MSQAKGGTHRVILVDVGEPPRLGSGADTHAPKLLARRVHIPTVTDGQGRVGFIEKGVQLVHRGWIGLCSATDRAQKRGERRTSDRKLLCAVENIESVLIPLEREGEEVERSCADAQRAQAAQRLRLASDERDERVRYLRAPSAKISASNSTERQGELTHISCMSASS